MLSEAKNILKTNGYDLLCQIGRGTYGKVFLTTASNNQYAVKIFNNELQPNWYNSCAIREINIMQELNNYDGFAHMKDYYIVNNIICIVMDYYDMSLYEYLYYDMTQSVRYSITKQLIDAIFIMHAVGIIHRDLKLDNIMVKRKSPLCVCIIDWGLSIDKKYLSYPKSFEIQTPENRSIEVYMNYPYNEKVDIWALGCMLYKLHTKLRLFLEVTTRNKIKDIISKIKIPTTELNKITQKFGITTKELYPPSNELYVNKRIPEDILKIIRNCLRYDPEERVSAQDLKQIINPGCINPVIKNVATWRKIPNIYSDVSAVRFRVKSIALINYICYYGYATIEDLNMIIDLYDYINSVDNNLIENMANSDNNVFLISAIINIVVDYNDSTNLPIYKIVDILFDNILLDGIKCINNDKMGKKEIADAIYEFAIKVIKITSGVLNYNTMTWYIFHNLVEMSSSIESVQIDIRNLNSLPLDEPLNYVIIAILLNPVFIEIDKKKIARIIAVWYIEHITNKTHDLDFSKKDVKEVFSYLLNFIRDFYPVGMENAKENNYLNFLSKRYNIEYSIHKFKSGIEIAQK